MTVRFTCLQTIVYAWALLSLIALIGWAGLFVLALNTAKQRSYGGHWWGRYILGLHALLKPFYLSFNQACPLLAKILAFIYQLCTLPFGMELPLAVRVGQGLTVSHTSGIVIHAGAIIGDNCVLHSGVVLGGKGRQDPPVIGNNVYIGANTVIAGAVHIGDNATIGACTLVVEDVPANALVGGERAKMLKSEYHRPYYNQGSNV